MATPHGDTRGKLNAGFMDFATTEALQDAQDAFGRSHTAEFDMCSTSDSFHHCLDPSILSIFENSSTEEEKNQIDEESEVTLLCALSDMLDNVIEDTLSPFDTLPNSELFMNQSQDTKLRRIHTLAVCPSEKEAAPRATRSTRSSLSNGKVEALHSDRQLRPRLHRKTHAASIQRSDGEDEDLSETRRHPVRIFRIEPDPALCQDDHQDRFVRVALADLVRHMHPYSLRVALDKESHRDVQEEEDVFVDVEGDDEMAATLLTTGSWCDLDSEQTVPPSGINTRFKSEMGQRKEEMQNVFSDQNKSCDTAQKSQISGRARKSVSFAADLTTVLEYQPEDELDMDGQDAEDSAPSAMASGEFTEAGKTSKPRALSLQEYRLLRQKMFPKEERRIDHNTKWPSVPETPTELSPIRFISGHNPAQVNLQTSCLPGSASKARRNLSLPLKTSPKRRKPVRHVDPPNPVTVPLKPPAPTDTKTSPPPSKEQHDMQWDVQGGHDAAHQASDGQEQPDSVRQEKKLDSPLKVVRSFPAAPMKANISAASSPVKSVPVQMSRRNLAPVQNPANSQCAEKQQGSAAEIGIEATDVTSLLEQFETQGLTPPATPPHQIWRPLAPTLKAKQHEAKQPSVKAIQIIEAQPLPPSRLHSKPQLHSSIPAPSITLAFLDHDYCRTQDFSNKKALSPVHMHDTSVKEPRSHASHKPLDNRTSCEEDCLSLSVLLSPESSPCRLEGSVVGDADDLEAPAVRGRTRRRCCRRKYRHSGSSSASSSSSPSSSSSGSSSSPPRKRHRSRYSDSSSRSSSCSSSSSLSPSPIRDHRRRYRLPQPRSFSGSRSRSRSPLDWNRSWSRRRECCRQSRLEEARQKQKSIEERRVVYVGRIRGTMTKEELRERFKLFGRIEDCTVHFRSHGDNYAFVTYYNTDDAFAAIENGTKLRQPDELPFDICFGGRRQFCKSNYMDLDSSRDTDPLPVRSRDKEIDFDTLLKQAQRGRKM